MLGTVGDASPSELSVARAVAGCRQPCNFCTHHPPHQCDTLPLIHTNAVCVLIKLYSETKYLKNSIFILLKPHPTFISLTKQLFKHFVSHTIAHITLSNHLKKLELFSLY